MTRTSSCITHRRRKTTTDPVLAIYQLVTADNVQSDLRRLRFYNKHFTEVLKTTAYYFTGSIGESDLNLVVTDSSNQLSIFQFQFRNSYAAI